jgi:hypothetical protein
LIMWILLEWLFHKPTLDWVTLSMTYSIAIGVESYEICLQQNQVAKC